MILAALVALFVAAVWLLAFCLCRVAAIADRDLPHAESGGAPLPDSAFDDVEFVYPPWIPYDGKRRLP